MKLINEKYKTKYGTEKREIIIKLGYPLINYKNHNELIT